jgi:hypothetical protein
MPASSPFPFASPTASPLKAGIQKEGAGSSLGVAWRCYQRVAEAAVTPTVVVDILST